MVSGCMPSQSVIDQLRMSGTLDAVRLIQGGYPTRIPYEAVHSRYACRAVPRYMHVLTTAPSSLHRYAKLLSDVPGVDMKSLTPAEFCEAISEACGVNKDEYSLGTTRMFFKMGAAAFLEELAEADPEEMKPKLMEMFALFEAKRR